MGRREYAKASIGIKILLSDLIQQINKDNWFLIKEMFKMKTNILTMSIKKSRILIKLPEIGKNPKNV